MVKIFFLGTYGFSQSFKSNYHIYIYMMTSDRQGDISMSAMLIIVLFLKLFYSFLNKLRKMICKFFFFYITIFLVYFNLKQSKYPQ